MIKTLAYNTKAYDREFLERARLTYPSLTLQYLDVRLTAATARLALGYEAVSIFVNDTADKTVLNALAAGGTKLIALRCAGFNNVDLTAAAELGIAVVRVPEYSPHAVAEFTLALILALNRKIHRAYNRVREGNFLLDGLLGFDLNGRTVGVIGTGKIGCLVLKILAGFGCQTLAYDPYPNAQATAYGATYVPLNELYTRSDIISLNCPLTPETYHLINTAALGAMRDGVMIVNTSRGAVIDAEAAIEALKTGKIGSLGLDVYEQEADLFFQDHSLRIIPDDVFSRLQSFPNVLLTGHQAYFTREALQNIASTTLDSLNEFATGKPLSFIVKA